MDYKDTFTPCILKKNDKRFYRFEIEGKIHYMVIDENKVNASKRKST